MLPFGLVPCSGLGFTDEEYPCVFPTVLFGDVDGVCCDEFQPRLICANWVKAVNAKGEGHALLLLIFFEYGVLFGHPQ